MRTSTPEVVKKEGLSEIMGAGRLVHWERPLLFALAWFTSKLAFMSLVINPYDEGVEWSVRAPSPGEVLDGLVASLVLAVLALVVLKLIGQVFLAVPVLALLYSLLSRPIFALSYRLQLGDYFDESDAAFLGAWFNLQIFTLTTVWFLLFFLSLALGLKLMSSRWLGLFLGAMGSATQPMGVLAHGSPHACSRWHRIPGKPHRHILS